MTHINYLQNSKKLRLIIPLLLVILMMPLACNTPTILGQEPTATPPPAEENLPTETAIQPSAEAVPTEIPVSSPSPQQDLSSGSYTGLSTTGPWVILAAQDRLWAANLDGSYSNPMVNQASISWYVQNVAVAPQGGHIAFTASWEANKRSHLTLFIMKVPEMTNVFTLELTPSNEDTPTEANSCDPIFEGLRAMSIGNGMAWSPDGKNLAFVGAQMGLSTDVYVYSVDRGVVTQAANEPSHAYSPSWSPDGKNIVFFSADCFGDQSGFAVTGAWSATPDGLQVQELYTIPDDSLGEKVLGWRDDRDVVVETKTSCPAINIRSINLDSKEETLLFEKCHEDAVMADNGFIAVTAGPEIAEDGLGWTFVLPADGTAAYYNPALPGHKVIESKERGSFFIIDTNMQAIEVGFDAQPGMVMYIPELPIYSPSGTQWAAVLGEDLVIGDSPTEGQTVYSGQIENVLWTADPVSGKEILFFLGGNSQEDMLFYRVIPPDLTPVPVNGFPVMGGPAKSRVMYP